MKHNYLITPYSLFKISDLKLLSKMILSEIISLSKLKGYCYASNSYFSNLYMITARTVSKAVSELIDNGYITIKVFKNNSRKIKVNYEKLKGLNVFLPEMKEKFSYPPEKSSTYNNNYNNKYNNSYKYNKKPKKRKSSYDLAELMKIE